MQGPPQVIEGAYPAPQYVQYPQQQQQQQQIAYAIPLQTGESAASGENAEGGTDGEQCVVRVGSLCFGIPLYVHYLFPALALIVLVQTAVSYHDEDWIGWALLLNALLYGVFLPVTVLIHELGHCAASIRFGMSVEKILLWPLGGLAYIGHTGATRGQDLCVSFSGPATHLPIFLLFLIFGGFQLTWHDGDQNEGFGPFLPNLFSRAAVMQVVLFCFNLCIPAYPLDGGRIFGALLTICFDVTTSAYIIVGVTVLCCIGLGLYAVISGGFFIFAVIIFIAFHTYPVFQLAQEGRAIEHPIFHREQQQQHQQGCSRPPAAA